MTQRLTPERERDIRLTLASESGRARHQQAGVSNHTYVWQVADMLAEIDALRAELAGAEERGSAREREAIAEAAEPLFAELEHSDTEAHGGEHFDDDCSVCLAIEALKERLLPVDHVRTGTTPPDAGDG